MKVTTDKTTSGQTPPRKARSGKTTYSKRLGWFVLIWALSVAAIATLGYGLRAIIEHIYGA